MNRPSNCDNRGVEAESLSLSAGNGRLIDGPAQIINVTAGDCGNGRLIGAADYADTQPAMRCPTCGARVFASLLALAAFILSAATTRAGALQTQPTLPGPPVGVQGNYVVGTTGTEGYIYNDTTETYSLIPSLGSAHGISGNLIVGSVGLSGALYNLSNQTTSPINDPLGAGGTYTGGIDGNYIDGSYIDASNKQHGFLYNLTTQTYTTLDYPGETATALSGISGNYIVGFYQDNSLAYHALAYNMTTSAWSTIGGMGYKASGIDGNNVVGNFGEYNLSTSTFSNPMSGVQFPSPGGTVNAITGISGNTLVGTYIEASRFHPTVGFVYIIPEPSSILLALLAAAGFAAVARRARGRDSPRP